MRTHEPITIWFYNWHGIYTYPENSRWRTTAENSKHPLQVNIEVIHTEFLEYVLTHISKFYILLNQ